MAEGRDASHLNSPFLPRLGGGVAVIRDGGGAPVELSEIGEAGRVAPPSAGDYAATSPETGREDER